jgi:hypothetical protein
MFLDIIPGIFDTSWRFTPLQILYIRQIYSFAGQMVSAIAQELDFSVTNEAMANSTLKGNFFFWMFFMVFAPASISIFFSVNVMASAN